MTSNWEQKRRWLHFQQRPRYDGSDLLQLTCMECGTSHMWNVTERGEWPPLDVECIDIVGIACDEEEGG